MDIKKILIITAIFLMTIIGFNYYSSAQTKESRAVQVAEAEAETETEIVAEPEEVAMVAEPEPEPVVDPEPEINGLDESSVVKSESSNMDFSTCLLQQAEFSEAISSSGNYNVIPIVGTDILSMVKFCTNDDSVIHTCSEPDNKMIVTISTNREGC